MRPVMSTRMSPVTTFMSGGRPPTPLGQEKPVPCMEQVQRTGSWMESGSMGGDVTGSGGGMWRVRFNTVIKVFQSRYSSVQNGAFHSGQLANIILY